MRFKLAKAGTTKGTKNTKKKKVYLDGAIGVPGSPTGDIRNRGTLTVGGRFPRAAVFRAVFRVRNGPPHVIVGPEHGRLVALPFCSFFVVFVSFVVNAVELSSLY
ncbi:MAG TPA: hypothetical protein VJ908_12625 [Wenzhouxiangellaceae bacterium]|nr:hypothetical protein [Wenzhouxiangellaceae bacterium]